MKKKTYIGAAIVILLIVAVLVGLGVYTEVKRAPYKKANKMISEAVEKAAAYNSCEMKIDISDTEVGNMGYFTLKLPKSGSQGYHTDGVYEEYWEKKEDGTYDIYMGENEAETYSHVQDTLSPDPFNPWLISDIWDGVSFEYTYSGQDGVWDNTGALCYILESKDNQISDRLFSRYLYINKDTGLLEGSIIRVEKKTIPDGGEPISIYIHGINTAGRENVVYKETFLWEIEDMEIKMPENFIDAGDDAQPVHIEAAE